jgi:hypothetical protein
MVVVSESDAYRAMRCVWIRQNCPLQHVTARITLSDATHVGATGNVACQRDVGAMGSSRVRARLRESCLSVLFGRRGRH